VGWVGLTLKLDVGSKLRLAKASGLVWVILALLSVCFVTASCGRGEGAKLHKRGHMRYPT